MHPHWLADGFQERSDYCRALLFRLARDILVNGALLGAKETELWLQLWAVTAQDAVRLATPFFWLNVYRVCAAAEQGALEREHSAVIPLYLSAWDSFNRAGAPAVCTLNIATPQDVVMPRHGLRFSLSPGQYELRRDSQPASIEVRGSGATSRRFSCIALPFNAVLVGGGNESVYESTYLKEVVQPDSIDLMAVFSTQLCEALALLRTAAPDFWSYFATVARHYVEIRTESADVHKSFTSPQLPRVTFLSRGKDRLRVLEAVVHEFSHDMLNRQLESAQLFEGPDEALYFSPWRDDPRPLLGLLHALYVFGQVAVVYMSMDLRQLLLTERVHGEQRLHYIYHAVLLGIAEVPERRLTRDGVDLIAKIRALSDEIGAQLGASREQPPTKLLNHQKRWLAPNLT